MTSVRFPAPPASRAIIGAAQSPGSRTCWKKRCSRRQVEAGSTVPAPAHPQHATRIDRPRPDHPDRRKRHRLKPRRARIDMTA